MAAAAPSAAAAVAAPGPGLVARVLPAVAVVVAAAILAPQVSRALKARRERRRRRQLRDTEPAAAPRAVSLAPPATLSDDAVGAAAWQRALVIASTEAVDTSEWPIAPLDNELVSTSLQCSPEELLLHLFHPASTYLEDWAKRTDVSHLHAQPWTYSDRPGALPWTRDVSYHMPIKQRMGPPVAHTTETQVLRAFSRNAWTVDVSAQTPNVPLGSTFRTLIKFTARASEHGGTDLHVSGQVAFASSSGFGPLRGMIQTASVAGMRTTYAAVAAELREAFAAHSVGVGVAPASGVVVAVAPRDGKVVADQLQHHAAVAQLQERDGKLARRTEVLQQSLLVFAVIGFFAALAQLPLGDAFVQPYLQMALARVLQALTGMNAV